MTPASGFGAETLTETDIQLGSNLYTLSDNFCTQTIQKSKFVSKEQIRHVLKVKLTVSC